MSDLAPTERMLGEILAELKLLNANLAAKPKAASYSGGSSGGGTGAGKDEPPPQPKEIVPNAGDVQVHFGKNNGVALSKLSERSLSWYATEQPPRLDSSGKPHPMRPQEATLLNAARTLWHQQKDTLVGHSAVDEPKRENPPAQTPVDEEVPF